MSKVYLVGQAHDEAISHYAPVVVCRTLKTAWEEAVKACIAFHSWREGFSGVNMVTDRSGYGKQCRYAMPMFGEKEYLYGAISIVEVKEA